MAITPEQIDLWRRSPTEHQRLEFKEAKTQFDGSKLCQYCVGIANEGGGNLILGIADDPNHTIVGTSAVNDPLGMTEKLFQDLTFRVDVAAVAHPDGRVVVFDIPSRPRGVAYAYKGVHYMRCGKQLVVMTQDKLREIFNEGKPDWLEEYSTSGIGAKMVVALLDTQAFFECLKADYPTSQDGVIEKLLDERLIDENNGHFHIRRIGALLFARDLQRFSDVSRKAPRVVVYTGVSKLEQKLEQVGRMGYAAGFQNLVSFIMSQLPQNRVIKDALSTEVKLVPSIMIRELVANALIHQDFTHTGTSVMIEVYSNRVEISNPGEPVVEVNRFIDGCRSRNERLAYLMRRFDICEELGSGIDKVVSHAEIYQLPAPDFRASNQRTEMIIYGQKEFEDMDRTDRIRACYQHCVLKYVIREKMTNQTLRERFHLKSHDSVTVTQIITTTIDEGMIKQDERIASRKYAQYVPYWA